MKYANENKISAILNTALILLILLLLTGIIRTYIIDWYRVSSNSMKPTLQPGELILATKNIAKIQVNDILVFTHPVNSGNTSVTTSPVYVKRCVGLPGDTVIIENGILKNSSHPTRIGLLGEQRKVLLTDSAQIRHYRAFPLQSRHIQWNIRNFGPLVIPAQGDTIQITPFTIDLYKTLIESETGLPIILSNRGFTQAKAIFSSYIFKKNYYFLCGDNCLSSYDSRYWGPIPEDHIIGKVMRIAQ